MSEPRRPIITSDSHGFDVTCPCGNHFRCELDFGSFAAKPSPWRMAAITFGAGVAGSGLSIAGSKYLPPWLFVSITTVWCGWLLWWLHGQHRILKKDRKAIDANMEALEALRRRMNAPWQ